MKVKVIMENCKEMVIDLSTEIEISKFMEFIAGNDEKYLDVKIEGWGKRTYIFLDHISHIIEL